VADPASHHFSQRFPRQPSDGGIVKHKGDIATDKTLAKSAEEVHIPLSSEKYVNAPRIRLLKKVEPGFCKSSEIRDLERSLLIPATENLNVTG